MKKPEEKAKARIIAIVGRPNVGKSAIFNRIVGKRVAIVHDQPGVTRDRISREAKWGEERFEVIDTGGLAFMDKTSAKDTMEDEARKQAQIAIDDAAVILFVVDVTAGLAPLDINVGRQLKESGCPVLLLANKADTDILDASADEFRQLGFPVFPVAALHNRGFEEVMDEAVRLLPKVAMPEKPSALRVAIVGRPNAGKSSFINRLIRSDRVIVSPVAGTTRDSVEIPFQVGTGPQARHYTLIDTAGMRTRGKVDSTVETFSLMRAEQSVEDADLVVLVMDGQQGPTSHDKRIASLILENRKGCVLLINKWDLMTETTMTAYEKAFRREIAFLDFAPLIFASTQSGLNIRKSIETIDRVAAQISQKLPTSALNRVVQRATERLQSPMVQGHRMKIYYATQTGERPIRIRLFVNDPKRMNNSYRLFLIRQIREAFGMEGAPIVLDFKTSHDGENPDGSDRQERRNAKLARGR